MDSIPDVSSRSTRILRHALPLLIVAGFLTGGSAQVSGTDDVVVQLAALGVLALALWELSGQPAGTFRNVALGVAASIMLVPVLQLLPLPAALWDLPEARGRLAADLAAVGAVPGRRWSLAPPETLQAAWFLLPPLAAFCATLAMPPRFHRTLLLLVLVLALFSLLLAFVQLGVPAESPLNPFPQWAAQFNGVFANQNHQAISLVVAIVIALTGMLGAIPEAGQGRRQAWTPWVLGFAALFALLALPLAGSRAAVLIAVFAVAAVPLALGVFHRRHLRTSRWARVGAAACLALVALGAWGTVGWMQVDAVDELRGPLREATSVLAREHAPLGTGIGAFVAAFEQGGPDPLLLRTYVNHAHNDLLQWWMEAGWLGLSVLCAVLAVLVLATVRALSGHRQDGLPAVASVVALGALLLHSWVDYPLRTGSLAIVAAVLAGILVSRASPGARRQRRGALEKHGAGVILSDAVARQEAVHAPHE